MDRRSFIGGAAAAAVLGLLGCAQDPRNGAGGLGSAHSFHVPERPSAPPEDPAPPSELEQAPAQAPALQRWPLPGGPIFGLPDEVGGRLAWTVDDGASPDVVNAYAQFAKETGTRLTFFMNGVYSSWAAAAPLFAPMVASGQVQIANHTFSHAGLTTLSDAQIQDELMRNHEAIHSIFGVDARPWYRPPYGWRDARTDAAAAAVGYTVPTMWYGSLGDSGLISADVMMSEAQKWLNPATIILGHANAPTVTGLFPWLTSLLQQRGISTVTLNDVFITA